MTTPADGVFEKFAVSNGFSISKQADGRFRALITRLAYRAFQLGYDLAKYEALEESAEVARRFDMGGGNNIAAVSDHLKDQAKLYKGKLRGRT